MSIFSPMPQSPTIKAQHNHHQQIQLSLQLEPFSLSPTKCLSPISKSSTEHHCLSTTPSIKGKRSIFAHIEPIIINKTDRSEITDLPSLTTSKFVEEQQKSKLMNRMSQGRDKLILHLKSMIKCDKYIRLLCSIIKTYRAYKPKTKLNKTYKQLILTRRVIRWQGKYDTLIDLSQNQHTLPMIIFKLFQIIGDFVDLSAFWLKTISTSSDPTRLQLIDSLQQTESNFYFTECIIWLCIYIYRYCKLRRDSEGNQQKIKQAHSKLIENGLKVIKYVFDVLTSYNNSSMKSHCGEINHKLAGYMTLASSIIGIYLLWK